MSFFTSSSSSSRGPAAPFSIDDAFDIPEEEDNEDDEDVTQNDGKVAGRASHGQQREDRAARAPIIKNGQIRIEMEEVGNTAGSDDASLIQSTLGTTSGEGDTAAAAGAAGYYPGPPSFKYWWMHPKIRGNVRVVAAACVLAALGLALASCGLAVFLVPGLGSSVQGVVFSIAGVICFVPGAYHLVYVYLAVKGKRGFDFNHLPLFNN